jgi:hypothetical protein
MSIITEALKFYLKTVASGREWAEIEVVDEMTICVDVGRISIDGVPQRRNMTRTYRQSKSGEIHYHDTGHA